MIAIKAMIEQIFCRFSLNSKTYIHLQGVYQRRPVGLYFNVDVPEHSLTHAAQSNDYLQNDCCSCFH